MYNLHAQQIMDESVYNDFHCNNLYFMGCTFLTNTNCFAFILQNHFIYMQAQWACDISPVQLISSCFCTFPLLLQNVQSLDIFMQYIVQYMLCRRKLNTVRCRKHSAYRTLYQATYVQTILSLKDFKFNVHVMNQKGN